MLHLFEVEYILDDGALENRFVWLPLFVLIPPRFFLHLSSPLSVSAPVSKMVRAALVTATSLALTGAVVAHAYLLKHQFYPTVVYLTKSSPSMAVRPAAVLLFINFFKFLSVTSGLDKSAFAYCFVSGIRCCTFRRSCWCFCWESSWGRSFLDNSELQKWR